MFQFYLMYRLICQKPAHFLSAQTAAPFFKCLKYLGCITLMLASVFFCCLMLFVATQKTQYHHLDKNCILQGNNETRSLLKLQCRVSKLINYIKVLLTSDESVLCPTGQRCCTLSKELSFLKQQCCLPLKHQTASALEFENFWYKGQYSTTLYFLGKIPELCYIQWILCQKYYFRWNKFQISFLMTQKICRSL